ncbi:uncharacterized protein [Aphelocoma coerulescens]|uniref:uncharacterized protein n=1 Tax=Aphelocoma coerulescens TaxID=39617 RepID=UPI003604673B
MPGLHQPRAAEPRRQDIPAVPTPQTPQGGRPCGPHTLTEGVPAVPTPSGRESPPSPHPPPPRHAIPAVPTAAGRDSPPSPHRATPSAGSPPATAATPGVSPPAAATPSPAHLPRPRATGSVGRRRGARGAAGTCAGGRGGGGRCWLSARRRSDTGDSSVREPRHGEGGAGGFPAPRPRVPPPRQGSDLETAALAVGGSRGYF